MNKEEQGNSIENPEQGSYIFGIRPIMVAIEAGKEIEKVYMNKDAQGELFRQLSNMLSKNNIRTQWVPVERLNRITRKNHQGAVAVLSAVSYASLEDVVAQVIDKGEVPLVLILDGVTDVRNFGAIVRSAECAGVHAVIMPAKGAAPISADAMKTSAGALNFVPVCRVNNIRTAIYFLKDNGFSIIAATEKATDSYFSTSYIEPTAIILGSEDTGISKASLELADLLVKIPILGKIESLNVSAAAAVIMFEAVKQRIVNR
ncbi:MAG: 23S rRNA (guanosine(2251)-2'-O)-methyltransferase RlmB [Prevotellaceae bacterium]|jgi:23S rRNA (guanosine2251-2'-O)-methyltransferase|nr:23S rRNA (guanosine(2251)-2'-O)-methyltransferase RlmB [Prevotellaceae bacterium]